MRRSNGLAPHDRRRSDRSNLRRSGRQGQYRGPCRRPVGGIPMNVAKWLLLGLLALPMAELAAFIAVAAVNGFVPALAFQIAGSLAGGLILRRAGEPAIS